MNLDLVKFISIDREFGGERVQTLNLTDKKGLHLAWENMEKGLANGQRLLDLGLRFWFETIKTRGDEWISVLTF